MFHSHMGNKTNPIKNKLKNKTTSGKKTKKHTDDITTKPGLFLEEPSKKKKNYQKKFHEKLGKTNAKKERRATIHISKKKQFKRLVSRPENSLVHKKGN